MKYPAAALHNEEEEEKKKKEKNQEKRQKPNRVRSERLACVAVRMGWGTAKCEGKVAADDQHLSSCVDIGRKPTNLLLLL